MIMTRVGFVRALVLVLFFCELLCGCNHRKPQHVVEAETINFVYRALNSYRAYHPHELITNMMQVFTQRGPYYPHDLDANFRAYGKYAGFTNSFYEKYIFFPLV